MNRLSPARLESLLERGPRTRILVVGDMMLDLYLRGSVSRVSPEAPVPVVRVLEEWRAVGGAANVAMNVVALGAACAVVGVVGTEPAGRDLREALQRAGIEDKGLRELEGRPTTVKTRVLTRQHQVARYDREIEEDVGGAAAGMLSGVVEDLAQDADAIVLEDYDKGVLVPLVIEAALDAARRRGIPVIVDPKSRHFFDYRGATVFKPNRTELEGALRAPVMADEREWMERTRRHLDCTHLMVTLGEDGMSLSTDEGAFVRVPTLARSVYDVSGAGDTVTAAVAVALAAGADIVEAAVLANHAAGIEVAKAGVATVSPEELRATVAALAAESAQD